MNIAQSKAKNMVSKIMILTLVFTLTMTNQGLVLASSLYSNASNWALAEIQEAYDQNLIPIRLLGSDMTKPATREELCELTVLLYEGLANQTIQLTSANPFLDTSNSEILKAYQIGITSGVSASTFAPNEKTTREQVATMFSRTLRKLYPTRDYSIKSGVSFSDQKDISGWALEHVLYMSSIGLIKGANGKFMPKAITAADITSGYGTTKREEAIAITIRTYKAFEKGATSEIETGSDIEEKEQLIASWVKLKRLEMSIISPKNLGDFLSDGSIYENSELFRPTYAPRISLSVESGFDSEGNKEYSNSPFTTLLKKPGSHNFKISLSNETRNSSKKIIWQLSRIPFDGNPIGALSITPKGLITTGQLSSSASSFSIDLNKLDLNTFGLKTFYLRAFPLDTNGKSIGDTGSGLPFVYGELEAADESPMAWNINLASNIGIISDFTLFQLSFSLKPAKTQGIVTYNGEFPNNFIDKSTATIDVDLGKTYSFLPENYPSKTQELRVQVSSKPYVTATASQWSNPIGLVYEESIYPDDPRYIAFSQASSYGVELDFSKWAPKDVQLPEKKIPYYVRVVALTSTKTSGVYSGTYSEVIQVNYGKPGVSEFVYYPEIMITANIPSVKKVQYKRPEFEKMGWQYHYVVFRQPTYKEVFPLYFGSDKDSLYPNLKVGTKVDFTPVTENKSWWEEAWDAVSNYFSDLIGQLESLTNWVSKSYANLKADLIAYVATTLPIPDEWKGPLEAALTTMVDSGLASMGIPPTLPNFDELTTLGKDYLTQVAIEQAGIPSYVMENGDDIYGKVEESIETLTTKSTQSATGNPFNYNFIKNDSDYMYHPAYIMLTIKNETNMVTAQGYLSGNVTHIMTQEEKSEFDHQYLYSKFQTTYFDLFKPVHGLLIPSLQPGQSLEVPIFLEPYVDIKMAGTNITVDYNDFVKIYNLEDFTFDFRINYDLISANEMAKLQNKTQPAIYYYNQERSSIQFNWKSFKDYNF